MNYLLTLLNHMTENTKVSPVLKEGLLAPVYKKGDKSESSNYRGITVTPVVLKILEYVLNQRHNQIFHKIRSKLQKGFTSGSSSMGGAMILSECINKAQNKNEPLFVETLDIQKAFDVVDHDILLHKLYLDGIWLLLRDLYADMTSSLKWEGHLSSPFIIRQGVRQGSVLSISYYKRYSNPLLIQIDDKYTETLVVSIMVPHITVADDLALLSRYRNDTVHVRRQWGLLQPR